MTEARTADTLDDPKRANDGFWCFSRSFGVVELIELVDGEPRTIPWKEFAHIGSDGQAINKEWLDQFMLRMNGAIPTEHNLSATSGLGTYRNAVKSLKNRHIGNDLAHRIERVKVEKQVEKDLLNLIILNNICKGLGIQLIVSR